MNKFSHWLRSTRAGIWHLPRSGGSGVAAECVQQRLHRTPALDDEAK